MTTTAAWTPLNDAGDSAAAVVLAVDYPFTGRPEAGFADLVGKLPGDYPVWETAPPVKGAETGLTGADYVDRWYAGVGDRPVRAVLGFCAGSVYAAALADRIAGDDPAARPTLLLFGPEAPNAITVYWQFHKIIDGLGVVLTPDEVAEAQREGQRISEQTTALPELGERLLEVFRRVAAVAFDRARLDAVRRADFVDTVNAFMSYLVAAATIDVSAGWTGATAISSRTETNGLNLVPPRERAGLVAREIRFDIEHADLLRDPDVVRAVAEQL
jgi:hypothetical protein